MALALPVSAEVVVSKDAEFCMKAADFAGCVETMTRGVSGKQKKDVEEVLRAWARDIGQIVRRRISTVVELKTEVLVVGMSNIGKELRPKMEAGTGSFRLTALIARPIGSGIIVDGLKLGA